MCLQYSQHHEIDGFRQIIDLLNMIKAKHWKLAIMITSMRTGKPFQPAAITECGLTLTHISISHKSSISLDCNTGLSEWFYYTIWYSKTLREIMEFWSIYAVGHLALVFYSLLTLLCVLPAWHFRLLSKLPHLLNTSPICLHRMVLEPWIEEYRQIVSTDWSLR